MTQGRTPNAVAHSRRKLAAELLKRGAQGKELAHALGVTQSAAHKIAKACGLVRVFITEAEFRLVQSARAIGGAPSVYAWSDPSSIEPNL